MEHLLQKYNSDTTEDGREMIPVLSSSVEDGYITEDTPSILNDLETLLPDEDEDEDAYNGNWDMINQIHGLEITKVENASGCEFWEARCCIARVLLYFDFLSEGVVDGSFA